MRLTISDHRREIAGLRYVYPVVSRRAGGVSVGINLNPNNACNWRCVYCQVPNLVRGAGPPIDLEHLRTELDGLLAEILHGDYLETHVDPPYRGLKDIAFSGNGEPTSSPHFAEAVTVVGDVLRGGEASIKVVVITNGSLIDRTRVQEGLHRVAGLGGEIWFKLDAGTDEGLARLNGASTTLAKHLARLREAARLCPTWIQTCLFGSDGAPPLGSEVDAYLGALDQLVADGSRVRGVLLYGIARLSRRDEGSRLHRLDEGWMKTVADAIEARGLAVRLSA